VASGKVARRTAVSDVAELLRSPEVEALIVAIEAVGDKRGRRGFGTQALVGACLVKGLFALPTWTWVAALIAEHPGLRDALGATPSVWACYRFSTKLRKNHPVLADCIDACVMSLGEQYGDFGRDVAIDASDLPAYGNGQRYVYQGGPERERFSDPDASWGHRSAVSTRSAGSFYGFKIHAAVCVATGLPLAWQIETGRRQESLYVAPLLDALRARGIRPETCAMDKGYDNTRVYAECAERGVAPVIPLRGAKKNQPALPLATGGRLFPRIPRHTQRFRDLYRGRGAVEREFGRLKNDWALAPLRVRGIERVQLHADLTILVRLAQALSRAREQAVPLAA
jgi:hypothetical protein